MQLITNYASCSVVGWLVSRRSDLLVRNISFKEELAVLFRSALASEDIHVVVAVPCATLA